MDLEPAQNTCDLKMFLAEVGQDKKNQLLIRDPNIIDTIKGASTITSLLASKLSGNMTMFAESYGKDSHCLFKAASLTTLTPATILEMVNCNWCNRRLEE